MAGAVVRDGFLDLKLPRIAGMASLPHRALQQVLRKIGLERQASAPVLTRVMPRKARGVVRAGSRGLARRTRFVTWPVASLSSEAPASVNIGRRVVNTEAARHRFARGSRGGQPLLPALRFRLRFFP